MSEARRGYRGYIASQPVRGTSFPQRIQNLVVRDYAARHGLPFLLSATEYAMPGCYMILENVVNELPRIEGMIAFSAFMLPKRPERRADLYERIFSAGAVLHAALENIVVRTPADAATIEDLLQVAATLAHVPGGGWMDKSRGVGDAAFWRALEA
jgi:sporadic carbohydrate cluster protein (TIGR04323 family)